MSADVVRLVVVDDDPLTRSALATILGGTSDLLVVGEAGDGRESLQVCDELDPDVVLMDVRMPVMDGLRATEVIVRRGLRARVLILTTFESDDYLFDALRAGASGFCLKRAHPDDMIDAIRIVARGESLVLPTRTRELVRNLSPTGRQRLSPAPDPTALLSERERQILACVARGLSNSEISNELTIGLETVKSHVSNVLTKLGARDRVQAVIVAYESGFAPSPKDA